MDEKITQRCGKQNPFKVPEGYFDTLNERIMTSVDKSERRNTAWIRRICFTAAAACVAGILIFNAYNTENQLQSEEVMSDADILIYDETYQKDMLNYSLVDNDDVYSYLAGVEY